MFTKKDLKTGMFGYFDNETDDWFVIVGDRFIYQRGSGDDVYKINDDLTMPSGRKITALYNGMSFYHAKRSGNAPIWKREKKKPLYNGKVVCVDLNGYNRDSYTVGKIYQVKDGHFTNDRGSRTPSFTDNVFHSFEDLCKYSASKWIEIKE